jgi:preprotein translocase subunit SecF
MMSRLGEIPGRLYRGEVSVNFVGRQRLWYTISGLILLISVVSLLTRGLNYSVDFKGGTIIEFKAPRSVTLTQVHNVLSGTKTGSQAVAQSVGTSGNWQVTSEKLQFSQIAPVQNALIRGVHAVPNSFSNTFVGPTWGSQISGKAAEALIIFLIVIVIYLSIAFEWKMASAAFVALIHDIVITVGVYSLCGFTVSPASVIGLLTILGYSLYDTVVVFDKVRENTAGLLGSGKSTYSQAANLALNQTLVRSINTSLIALLPVAAILFIGSAVLGPGELQDLALVLFVGMLSGTYSSICIATPVLAGLKEREHQYKVLAKRVALREAGGRSGKRAAAKGAKATDAGTGPVTGGDVGTAAAALADPAGGPTIRIGRGAGPAARPGAGSQPGAGGPVSAGPVSAGAAPDDVDTDLAGADIGDGYDGEPEDVIGSADPAAGPDRVPAGRSAPNGGPPYAGARPGPRQQPRRTSSAKRRPGGKRKKR